MWAGTAGMNTEEARVKTGIRNGDERGVRPACDGDPPRRSVEILRDLGLSTECRARIRAGRFPGQRFGRLTVIAFHTSTSSFADAKAGSSLPRRERRRTWG